MLMDQRILAGVGNIYANEALWRAGVDPSRAADRVTVDEAVRLRDEIVAVLEESIALRGTSFRRLSRRERLARKFRRPISSVRPLGRALHAVRSSIDRHSRGRRPDDGAMRALSKVALIRPPTSDEQLAVMRAHVRDTATDRPAVYRMIAADGEIVYVGKSKQVRSRLLSYFRCAFPEEKGARILRDAEHIEWEYMPSEFAALLEELRLIKRYRPRFNVAMKRDGRNYCFIKITRGPAPKLVVVRGPGADDSSIYYGPFMGASGVADASASSTTSSACATARPTSECISPTSPSCSTFFPARRDAFGSKSRSAWVHASAGARFSSTTTAWRWPERFSTALTMVRSSTCGARWKRRANDWSTNAPRRFATSSSASKRCVSQFARLRFAVETLSFVYTVPGHDGDDRVYLIRRGRVRAETALPREPAQAGTLLRLIDEVFTPIERDTGQIPTHEIDELLLLSSWFRRFPDELERTSAARGRRAARRRVVRLLESSSRQRAEWRAFCRNRRRVCVQPATVECR